MNGNFPLVRTIKNNIEDNDSFEDEDIIVKIHDEALKDIENDLKQI
jgi:hypothetical protein